MQWSSELARDTILTILLALVAVAAPLYGLLFSAMVAVDRHRRDHRLMRNVAVACAAVAFLGLFVAYWPAGRAGPVVR